MISFTLSCEESHRFDGWFRNGDDFEAQKARGLVSCPVCGSTETGKALMAPAVSTGGKREQIALAMGAAQKKLMADMKAAADKVRETADYVGPSFAEEARKIHFGEVEARGIYGEASQDEARALVEDGVEFMPLPVFPEERN